MVIPQIAARNALFNRLKAVFSAKAIESLYPGITVPIVTLGFPPNERAFNVAVDEIVTDLQTVKGASCGQSGTSFSINVWITVRKSDLTDASDTAMEYGDAVIASVLADQTLKDTVDHATASVQGGGTAADADKKSIATLALSVACDVWAVCPDEMRKVINEANV